MRSSFHHQLLKTTVVTALLTASLSTQAYIPDTPLGQPSVRAGLNLIHQAPSYETVEDLSEGAYLVGVSLTTPLNKIYSKWSKDFAVGVRADWMYHDASFRDTVQYPDGTTIRRHTNSQVSRIHLYPEVSYNLHLTSTWDLQLGVFLGGGRVNHTGTRTNADTGARVEDNPLPVDLGKFDYTAFGARGTFFYKDLGIEISAGPQMLGVSLVIR